MTVRLEEAKASVLVLIGVRADGSKELIAMDSGYRESAESWANLLRDAERRGMRAPVPAVGDGALGFWTGFDNRSHVSNAKTGATFRCPAAVSYRHDETGEHSSATGVSHLSASGMQLEA